MLIARLAIIKHAYLNRVSVIVIVSLLAGCSGSMTSKMTNEQLVEQLLQHSVTKVVVEYSGSGDSGQLDEVRCTDKNNGTVTLSTAVIEKIDDLVYDLLEQHYSGWEINDGSSGEIILSLQESKQATLHRKLAYEINHISYYTESESETASGVIT